MRKGQAVEFLSLMGITALAMFTFSKILNPDRIATFGIFPLAQTWGYGLVFACSAFAFGAWVLSWSDGSVPRDGALPLALSIGTLSYSLAVGALGPFGALNQFFFWGLPVFMLTVGTRPALSLMRLEWRQFQNRAREWSFIHLVLVCLGAVCAVLVVLQSVTPENSNYDARWYHLRMPERYALAGRLMRFEEGDYLGVLPQGGSWLYTWAFLRPACQLFDKVQLAMALEAITFLGTLALIPALARAVAGKRFASSLRLSWVAFFFFPSIFVYDTGLMGGADHIAAYFGTAVVLAWLQARNRRDQRSFVLFGFLLAGILAKHSVAFLLLPIVALVVVEVSLRRVPLPKALSAAFIALVFSAPYWLKNVIWYGNPVYPIAAKWFPSRPWTIHSQAFIDRANHSTAEFHNLGTTTYVLGETVRSLWAYSVEHFTFGDFVGYQAVFGVAYLICLPGIFLLRDRGRFFLAAVVCHAAIALWFLVNHQMRYLTTTVPLMAACVAVVVSALWARAWCSRALVLVLAATHCGAFVQLPFLKTHRMTGKSPLENAGEYLVNARRRDVFSQFETIGQQLPPLGNPLVHGVCPVLGLGRQSLTDVAGLQLGISYAAWKTPMSVLEHLRGMGATHLIWPLRSQSPDSIAGEALFFALAAQTVDRKSTSGYSIGALPTNVKSIKEKLLYLGCSSGPLSGIYRLESLSEPLREPFGKVYWPQPILERSPERLLEDEVDVVVAEDGCGLAPNAALFDLYGEQVAHHRMLRYYIRRVFLP
jgi:hypothetical protein